MIRVQKNQVIIEALLTAYLHYLTKVKSKRPKSPNDGSTTLRRAKHKKPKLQNRGPERTKN